MYKQVVELLEEAAISYKQYTYEPILDYETDSKIRERFKLEGLPSKSLFLKDKSNNYYIFVTFEWKQYMLPETNEESVMRCPITG
ncbi:hypothetical protein LAV80_12550 [Bacillus wiedmannii]